MNHDVTELASDRHELPGPSRRKLWIGLLLLAALFIGLLCLRPYLDGETLGQWSLQQEVQLRKISQLHPIASWLTAFVIYVLVAGLALPVAVFVSIFYGWWLGFWQAVVLVSFASTAGASLAFLISRSLFGDYMQRRYQQQLAGMNRAFEEEGAFYLFSLRLMPVVPFFLVNLLMGLTTIRLRTFWWVSQLGMLPGTMVYIYAGSSLPKLKDVVKQGGTSLVSVQLLVAFALIGLFPLIVKKVLQRFGPQRRQALSSEPADEESSE